MTWLAQNWEAIMTIFNLIGVTFLHINKAPK
jgi:hypothetical protein